ncbi:MAG: YciI family protein [Hyphomonadaceae bacterium]|nr:YciI family protein [Hyphomonadaceae bacterium]
MQYMLLIYGEEAKWAALAPEKISEVMAAYFAYTEDLAKAGKLKSGDELQPVETAKTVSLETGKRQVVDGPFADTKETLGGYYLIEADNIDEAVEWAARCPGARQGRIEVRPVVMR